MTTRSFPNLVAHAASPWDWRPAAFVAYVVVVSAVSVAVVAAPLVQRGFSDGLIQAAFGLVFAGIYLRALARSIRLRRTAPAEVAASLN